MFKFRSFRGGLAAAGLLVALVAGGAVSSASSVHGSNGRTAVAVTDACVACATGNVALAE